MSVSKRSPRNLERRKHIGVGHNNRNEQYFLNMTWERNKKQRAAKLERKLAKVAKRKEARLKREHFEKRGVL